MSIQASRKQEWEKAKMLRDREVVVIQAKIAEFEAHRAAKYANPATYRGPDLDTLQREYRRLEEDSAECYFRAEAAAMRRGVFDE
jgi:hypothetical protein